MSDQFLREVEPHLARLARGPGNAGALADLRAAFAEARAEAGHGPAAELARSAENLLSAQLDGYVPPTEETAELVAEAARALFAPDPSGRADLAERMDAAASGIDTASLDALPQPPRTGRPEPPLLTEREDGVFVSPGMFADTLDNAKRDDAPLGAPPSAASAAAPAPANEAFGPPVASTTVAPQPVADAYPEPAATPDSSAGLAAIAGDINAATENLDRQISALVTIASGDDETSTVVQHTAGELAATAAEIKRHSRALAHWAEGHNAPRDAAGGQPPQRPTEQGSQGGSEQPPPAPGDDVPSL